MRLFREEKQRKRKRDESSWKTAEENKEKFGFGVY
jgi:hypothetical protein